MSLTTERVAAAIYESIFADKFPGGRGIEADQYRQAAKAALEASGIAELTEKIGNLQRLLVKYGDKGRMAWAEPAADQQLIDEAFEAHGS